MIIMMSIFPEEKTSPTRYKMYHVKKASFTYFFFPPTEAQKLPYYSSYGHIRLMIHTLCTNHYLDLIITFIICINVITMSLEHFNQPHVRRNGCLSAQRQCFPQAEDLILTLRSVR